MKVNSGQLRRNDVHVVDRRGRGEQFRCRNLHRLAGRREVILAACLVGKRVEHAERRRSETEPEPGDRRLLALDLSDKCSQQRFDLVHLVRLGFETN